MKTDLKRTKVSALASFQYELIEKNFNEAKRNLKKKTGKTVFKHP